MRAARTRIGKITPKLGGAVIVPLNRHNESHIINHMRESMSAAIGDPRGIDVYFFVTMKFDPAHPGRPDYEVSFCSVHDSMPHALLAEIGGAMLRGEVISWRSEVRTMRALGYELGWNPEDDPAA